MSCFSDVFTEALCCRAEGHLPWPALLIPDPEYLFAYDDFYVRQGPHADSVCCTGSFRIQK